VVESLVEKGENLSLCGVGLSLKGETSTSFLSFGKLDDVIDNPFLPLNKFEFDLPSLISSF